MNVEIDKFNDKYQTGDICPKSGTWICKEHPAVEIHQGKGKIFPNCYHVSGHRTIWWYLVT